MLPNDYEGQRCSIAAALEVVGERWSLLIVREIFLGVRRFDEMQSDLGIARNVLQTRLRGLAEGGSLRRGRAAGGGAGRPGPGSGPGTPPRGARPAPRRGRLEDRGSAGTRGGEPHR